MSEQPAAALTLDEIARELVDVEAWCWRELGLVRGDGWDMGNLPEPFLSPILVRERAQVHFVSEVGFQVQSIDELTKRPGCLPDGPTVKLVRDTALREAKLYTAGNLGRAVATCPSLELAKIFEDLCFAIAVARWNMIEGRAAAEPFRPDPDGAARVRARARESVEALRNLYTQFSDPSGAGEWTFATHLQILPTCGDGAEMVDLAVRALREIIDLHDAGAGDRRKVRARFGFALSVVIAALYECWDDRARSVRRGFPQAIKSDGPETTAFRAHVVEMLDDILRLLGEPAVVYQPDPLPKVLEGLISPLLLSIAAADQARIQQALTSVIEVQDFSRPAPEGLGYLFHFALLLANAFQVADAVRGALIDLACRVWRAHPRDLRHGLSTAVPGRRFVAIPAASLCSLLDLALGMPGLAGLRYETEPEAASDEAMLDACVGLIAQIALSDQPALARPYGERMAGFGPGALSWTIRAQTLLRRMDDPIAANLSDWVQWLWALEVPDDMPLALDARVDALVEVTRRIAWLPEAEAGALFRQLEQTEGSMRAANDTQLVQVIGRTLLHRATEAGDWSPEAAERLRRALRGFDLLGSTGWANGQLGALRRLADALPPDDPDRQRLMTMLPRREHDAKVVMARKRSAEAALTPDDLSTLLARKLVGAARGRAAETSLTDEQIRQLLADN